MSNVDLLKDSETMALAGHGLQLCYVYENGDARRVLTVLPIAFGPALPHAEAARRALSAMGMNGDAVAMKALVAISRDAMPPATRRKKAKT
jgi:hypothetical protein